MLRHGYLREAVIRVVVPLDPSRYLELPALRLVEREVVRLQPNLNALYNRLFPLLVPLGPLFGVLARERRGPGGDVIRLTLERLPDAVSAP